MQEILEGLPSLSPADFFSVSCDVHYSKAPPTAKLFGKSYLLPDTSGLLSEERFATLSLAWNEKALFLEAVIQKPYEQAFFPEFRKGDCLELFFDTRDLKNAGFLTRFCHHFLILPEEIDGARSQEITRFRTEDSHPLCDPADIEVKSHFGKQEYRVEIHIPAFCLHAYDPSAFDRLGFTYRINRLKGEPQHFALSSHSYPLEKEPSLWASLKFIK